MLEMTKLELITLLKNRFKTYLPKQVSSVYRTNTFIEW